MCRHANETHLSLLPKNSQSIEVEGRKLVAEHGTQGPVKGGKNENTLVTMNNN